MNCRWIIKPYGFVKDFHIVINGCGEIVEATYDFDMARTQYAQLVGAEKALAGPTDNSNNGIKLSDRALRCIEAYEADCEMAGLYVA